MSSWIEITDNLLPTDEVHRFLYESEGGGVCVFSGITRKETNGKITVHLSYDTHKTMALKEMKRLAQEASGSWPLLRVVMLHRTGIVNVGEASVIIGVATAHRGAAFEAVRFLIDELKKSVQIWKREKWDDGSTEWQGEAWL